MSFHLLYLKEMMHQVEKPGKYILESMDWLKMSPSEFASRLGITEETLLSVIAGDKPIDNDLAMSLESITGSPQAYWKMLQRKYLASLRK